MAINMNGGVSLSGSLQANRVNYWITTLSSMSGSNVRGLVTDSSDNAYSVGRYTNGSGGVNAVLVKTDSFGSVIWEKGIEVGTSNAYLVSATIDSNGDIAVCGRIENSAGTNSEIVILKYNASGTLLWQRLLGSTSFDNGWGIAADSSNNLFICGETYSQSAGANDAVIAKYNSSGTIQWQRRLGGTSFEIFTNIAVDSTGAVYACGSTSSQGQGGDDLLLVKYDTNGNITWQRRLGGTLNDQARSITTDTLNNIYVSGLTSRGEAGQDALLVKYNSAGTLQWQRRIGADLTDQAVSVDTDSSGNVYITGPTSAIGLGVTCFIAKYDASGDILWQNRLRRAVALPFSSDDITLGISVDTKGAIVISALVGRSNNIADLMFARLPSDGSRTGIYGSYVYDAAGLTTATTTLTAATATLTAATTTLTASTPTYATVTPTVPGVTIVIG